VLLRIFFLPARIALAKVRWRFRVKIYHDACCRGTFCDCMFCCGIFCCRIFTAALLQWKGALPPGGNSMAFNKCLMAAFLVTGAALGGIAGCGGSRNSGGSDDPPDFTLGSGKTEAQWASSSTEVVHDLSRDALYYLDVENREVVAIDVASGDDSLLLPAALLFDPFKMRLTADSKDLYILESRAGANETDGAPNLARYNIAGDFIDADFINLDVNKNVSDFAVTNNSRVIVASSEIPAGSTPSVQWLSLYSGESGALFDAETFGGVTQQLTLNRDQVTLFDQTLIGNGYYLETVSIGAESVVMSAAGNLLLSQGGENTYEPEGDRIFRSNGDVLDGNKTINLGSSYESIDFDLVAHRIVILVRGNGFLVRYFDIDSLELLSEKALPTVADAAGMEPIKLFVDDGDLYVVYREVTSAATREYLLVKFDYPH